ncbi:uncharacterized protein METZ01_LOCUS215388 [marine metagenome]|uniref:Uncharacterized protein n=1 Tax=marine metagenome TaxID=408172 RepID=A0A382FJQ0_9ZZZZ
MVMCLRGTILPEQELNRKTIKRERYQIY